jgi:hypothetical protein
MQEDDTAAQAFMTFAFRGIGKLSLWKVTGHSTDKGSIAVPLQLPYRLLPRRLNGMRSRGERQRIGRTGAKWCSLTL